MRYSREYLERLAGQTGFRPDTLEKVLRLERFLDQVNRHPYLGPRVALKGGTALNVFYGQAPRLSVDLDFNYIGALDREKMLRERPDVERAVEQSQPGRSTESSGEPRSTPGENFTSGTGTALGLRTGSSST